MVPNGLRPSQPYGRADDRCWILTGNRDEFGVPDEEASPHPGVDSVDGIRRGIRRFCALFCQLFVVCVCKQACCVAIT
jgi:hypothetical protein